MNLRRIAVIGVTFLLIVTEVSAQVITPPDPPKKNLFPGSHRAIQYVGRVDFTVPKKPRFWASGVYVKAKFVGTHIEVTIVDEVKGGTNHNSVTTVIDDGKPVIHTLKEKINKIKVASNLEPGEHVITICKNTEASVGFIEVLNMTCDGLLPLPLKGERKIEFIGNSTTAGSGMDVSRTPCGKDQSNDQHNVYESYGPVTARALQAQWHVTALSNIGLIKSWNLNFTMPQVYDKVNIADNTMPFNASRYSPDVITVCLGENDGPQDSVKFCSAYVQFVGALRNYHPKARIILLSSPMSEPKFSNVLKNYLTGVVDYLNENGDKNVSKYFFSRSFNSGCGGHPDTKEHQMIAKELTAYIVSIMEWTSL